MKYLQKAVTILLLVIVFSIISPTKGDADTPPSLTVADIQSSSADVRIKILQDYLKQFNSPLAAYSYSLVKQADANNIDWRLLAAISGVESTYAQAIPANSYNAWGWGIYGDQTKYFASWDDAISTISSGLRQNYINKLGTDDVYVIGKLYAASPTWAQRVDHNMREIDRFAAKNPSYSLTLSI